MVIRGFFCLVVLIIVPTRSRADSPRLDLSLADGDRNAGTDFPVLDLGKVVVGETIPFVVSITNCTKKDAVVEDVHVGCKCVTGETGRREIPVGQTADFHLGVDISRSGDRSTEVAFQFADHPDVRLKVRLRAVDPFEFNPPVLPALDSFVNPVVVNLVVNKEVT